MSDKPNYEDWYVAGANSARLQVASRAMTDVADTGDASLDAATKAAERAVYDVMMAHFRFQNAMKRP